MGNTDSLYQRRKSSIKTSHNSITPLYEACRIGDEEQVQKLLPKYSINELNRQEYPYGGNTCLHIAAANGHDNIVKLLLKYGCYRSSFLNSRKQSAYDVAVENKESTRLLFLRQYENESSSKSSSRFYEQNLLDCFDIVHVDDSESLFIINKNTPIQTYKSEEEKNHAIEYSASSKAMCQSRFGRVYVNFMHNDDPLDNDTIQTRLNTIMKQLNRNNSDDYIKLDELIQQYEKNPNSIEYLLHLYTLETTFYHILKKDCLPLAIPLFIHLPKLKERFFKGRVYSGMYMTKEQLLTYEIAMETSGTLLQTRCFTSTSIDRNIAEKFAYLKKENNNNNGLSVLFIFDFPTICDQAINLSRISSNIPCLSEYEDEKEVLILPWTFFKVTRIRKVTDDDDDICTIYLTNIIIPKKNLFSSFKWNFVDLKNHLIHDKKIVLDFAFQKHKQHL